MERTSDISDAATNLETESREFTINGIREAAKRLDTSNPSGECWWCGEETGTERKWCNTSCRDDYEKYNA